MASQLNASLLRLKLLDALRSGDISKIEAVNESLDTTKLTTQNTDVLQLKTTILHYAVQVAPLSIIQHLVNNREKFNIDINSQDQDGNTPLHLAAIASRGEVVKYLLSLPNINDTTLNLQKKQPVELCKDIEIIQLMQFERAKFVEKLAAQLREYFTNRDFKNLENLLVSNPRAAELLDINGADPETGNTVLHEFIGKNDLQMCDWILKHGGDPFKRDKRGKLPIDLIQNKTDPIRKLLKVASKDQTIMDPVLTSNNSKMNAPTYKGYLKKWTNFASGYKLRYFVLDDKGILSYYTNQDDTNNACRGSLNLGFAFLHLDSSEKLKFEIIGKNGIRWHLKANHPIETNRWVWNLQNAITLAKDNIKKIRSSSTGNTTNQSVNTSINTSFDETRAPSSPIPSSRLSSDEPSEGRKHHLLSLRRKHKRTGSLTSLNSQGSYDDEVSITPSKSSAYRKDNGLGKIKENSTLRPLLAFGADQSSFIETDNENFDYDLDDLEDDEDDYDSEYESAARNHKTLGDEISTIKGSLDVEIKSVLDLFQTVLNSPDSLDSEILKVANGTLITIQDLFGKYNALITSKDIKASKKLDRQLEVNKLWENSIRQLEDEIANREQKLVEFEGKKKQLKKILSSKASGAGTPSTEVAPAATLASELGADGLGPDVEDVIEDILNDSDEEFYDADDLIGESLKSSENLTLNSNQAGISSTISSEKDLSLVKKSETNTEAITSATEEADDKSIAPSTATLTEQVPSKSEAAYSNELHTQRNQLLSEEGSFLGYENPPRTKLKLDEDDRPKVGLWGILKSMIGKDMTRMTLPVSFNECTSLLQRLTEDIEYSDLLDQAASYDDSTLRTAYVAAFASSEYASTINRIAKPFNPLLGETFEYCRPDKNYRLICEQVSHHPPISACSAESIKWDYYGENAVDSKFKGRSFDFKHLGKMFCVVRPDNGVIDKNGNKVTEELYSWKKVNTSVVGIIVGNPTVDNYGEMVVTNHTTGDKIIVDMKQRGWRASSAYQLSGTVVDKNGQAQWAIGGHWNSKIFGKKLSPSKPNDAERRGSLVEKPEISTNANNDPFHGGAFLIWQAAPRPKIPFNLTSFAVTLNGIDDNLKEFLAPTDTRLRPDQRAMEDGEYDKAADEKHRVEEKQRAARKEREMRHESYKPNWFVKKRHPVTGDAFWEFKGEYWRTRKDKKLEGCGDIF